MTDFNKIVLRAALCPMLRNGGAGRAPSHARTSPHTTPFIPFINTRWQALSRGQAWCQVLATERSTEPRPLVVPPTAPFLAHTPAPNPYSIKEQPGWGDSDERPRRSCLLLFLSLSGPPWRMFSGSSLPDTGPNLNMLAEVAGDCYCINTSSPKLPPQHQTSATPSPHHFHLGAEVAPQI